jgi:uncharacterized membrane protein (UPF0127 family)
MKSFVLFQRLEDKNRNRIIIVSFLIFVVGVCYIVYGTVAYSLSKLDVYTYGNDSSIDGADLRRTNVICGDDNKFKTYVAIDAIDQEKGLSVFNKIKSNEAMLFVFDNPQRYSFWMKDMKFSIDILWLDQNKKIVDIKKDVSVYSYPSKFTPISDSLYVLEFNTGIADKLNIKIGDICNFDSFSLK